MSVEVVFKELSKEKIEKVQKEIRKLLGLEEEEPLEPWAEIEENKLLLDLQEWDKNTDIDNFMEEFNEVLRSLLWMGPVTVKGILSTGIYAKYYEAYLSIPVFIKGEGTRYYGFVAEEYDPTEDCYKDYITFYRSGKIAPQELCELINWAYKLTQNFNIHCKELLYEYKGPQVVGYKFKVETYSEFLKKPVVSMLTKEELEEMIPFVFL